MYGSDWTEYVGACTCDDCFTTYLKQYAGNWQSIYEQVAPQQRGAWLGEHGAAEHYRRHHAKRIEAQYDALRARCQAVNPAFLFGYAPDLEDPPRDIPGLARGLGTSSHPCLVFSEFEYTRGVTHQSLGNIRRVVRDGLPALYLSGQFLASQAPDTLADNALFGSLYGDGWWAYFGGALLNNVGLDNPAAFGSYKGRVSGTTAADYLDRLVKMHAQLDDLLTRPQKDWPKASCSICGASGSRCAQGWR